MFIRQGQVTGTEVLQSFFPVVTESYWFITTYQFAKLELFKRIINKVQKLDEIQVKSLSEQCDKQ